MHKLIRTLGSAMLALTLVGCGLVYVPNVQQGNFLDKKDVDQLKPGMTKHQVLVLLGSPSVHTPFNQNRWDYVSTQQHRGGKIKIRTFTLTFNNDTLVRTDGDFFAQDPEKMLEESKKYHVTYPVDENQGDKNTSGTDDSGSTPPDNGNP
ncbi:outer membrane protein assembly factor BamE [Frateuria edaphi]|jgi:outer membrane protein assembly factor BamE|uniref:outer membrane protein assembly factor BamE n=1 Tax=Frateuria TaxID=70411 RepID=UPI001E2D8995|nr:outer membrane protein assembly factor BamE [Frateuria edaphi]UGB47025.1 outer membrane protein assembly factor BamE [Frateuria edaphi]